MKPGIFQIEGRRYCLLLDDGVSEQRINIDKSRNSYESMMIYI